MSLASLMILVSLLTVLGLAFVVLGNNRVIDRFTPTSSEGSVHLFWYVWMCTAWKLAVLGLVLLCGAALSSLTGPSDEYAEYLLCGIISGVPFVLQCALSGLGLGLLPGAGAGLFCGNKTRSKIGAAVALLGQAGVIGWVTLQH